MQLSGSPCARANAVSRRSTGFRSCKVRGAVIKGIYRFQWQLRGRSGNLDTEMRNIFPRLGRAKVRFPEGEADVAQLLTHAAQDE